MDRLGQDLNLARVQKSNPLKYKVRCMNCFKHRIYPKRKRKDLVMEYGLAIFTSPLKKLCFLFIYLFIYLFSYVSESPFFDEFSESPLNEKNFKFHFKKFLQLVPNLIITFMVFVFFFYY